MNKEYSIAEIYKLIQDKIKVEKQKIFLMSRGFGYHIIEKAINRFWKL